MIPSRPTETGPQRILIEVIGDGLTAPMIVGMCRETLHLQAHMTDEVEPRWIVEDTAVLKRGDDE